MKSFVFSTSLGAALLLLAGCGGSSNDISSSCQFTSNTFHRDSSSSGPISYDCTSDAYSLINITSLEVTGVTTDITASTGTSTLTIDSDAVAGTEHRVGSHPDNGPFDCVNTYVSELPVTVSNENAPIRAVVAEWPNHWTLDPAHSTCPQWVTDLNPDDYNAAEKQYTVNSNNGTSKITIKTYYQ